MLDTNTRSNGASALNGNVNAVTTDVSVEGGLSGNNPLLGLGFNIPFQAISAAHVEPAVPAVGVHGTSTYSEKSTIVPEPSGSPPALKRSLARNGRTSSNSPV